VPTLTPSCTFRIAGSVGVEHTIPPSRTIPDARLHLQRKIRASGYFNCNRCSSDWKRASARTQFQRVSILMNVA
jgi:hypothetical protein